LITTLHEQRTANLPQAQADGESLWLTRDEILQATGWDWKPEGLCQGDICLPLPRGREATLVRGERLDLAGLWQAFGHPVVHDAGGRTWVLGTGAADRARTLASGQAPDFALPDLEGRPHRLSEHRGRKVLLATWSSW
jgi:hypothetical protein